MKYSKIASKAKSVASKAKTFAKKNKKPLATGAIGLAGGTAAGYQSGKTKGKKDARKAIAQMSISDAAASLGIKNAKGLSLEQKKKIAKRASEMVNKRLKQAKRFYS
jgi:hypothetical protein